MTELTLNNQIITLSEERIAYNNIRRKYKKLAQKASDEFARDYNNNFQNIDDVHNKCTGIAMKYLESAVEAAIRDLIASNIMDVDEEIFTKQHMSKYYSWDTDFGYIDDQYMAIVLSAEELDQYRSARRESRGKWVGGGFGVGGAIKGAAGAAAANLAIGALHGAFNLAAKGVSAVGDMVKKNTLFNDPLTKPLLVDAVYQLVFNVHYGFISAASAHFRSLNKGMVNEDDKTKSERIFNNITKGRITGNEAIQSLQEALLLNPYKLDIYLYWVENFGDSNGEIETLAEYFSMPDFIFQKKKLLLARKSNLDFSDVHSRSLSVAKLKEYAHFIGLKSFDENYYTINFQVVNDSTLRGTGPYEEIFDYVKIKMENNGGNIKQDDPGKNRLEASWKYGSSIFGLKVEVLFKKIDDSTCDIVFKGDFKEGVSNNKGTEKAKEVMNIVLGRDMTENESQIINQHLEQKAVDTAVKQKSANKRLLKIIGITVAIFFVFMVFAIFTSPQTQSSAPTSPATNSAASRSAPADTLLQNGLWRDPDTNIIWSLCEYGMKFRDGQCEGYATSYSWSDATSKANSFDLLGMKGWRLPTKNEYNSLANKFKAGRKSIPATLFPAESYYWTGTKKDEKAWVFMDAYNYLENTEGVNPFRLVFSKGEPTAPVSTTDETETSVSTSESFPSTFNAVWVKDFKNCDGAKSGESDSNWIKIDGLSFSSYESFCEISRFASNTKANVLSNPSYHVELKCSAEGSESKSNLRLTLNNNGRELLIDNLDSRPLDSYKLCDK